MTRSKKIFAWFALAFLLAVGYLAYDIGSRTTFPGRTRSGKQAEEPADSASIPSSPDSVIKRP